MNYKFINQNNYSSLMSYFLKSNPSYVEKASLYNATKALSSISASSSKTVSLSTFKALFSAITFSIVIGN